MARSGLFPPFLGELSEGDKLPVKSLLTGAAVALLLTMAGWLLDADYEYFISGGILAAVCAYISTFISFIIFRVHYKGLQRKYVSKTGVTGAAFGIIISSIIFIGVVVERKFALLVWLVMIVSFTLYYKFVAAARQRLSVEEKDVMLIAHVIKGKG
jgi:ethanolamine permease